MARVLHLLKAAPSALAETAIAEQVRAGDDVTVVALENAPAIAAPSGVAVHRVPGDLSYEALLERIFEAEQVIAW